MENSNKKIRLGYRAGIACFWFLIANLCIYALASLSTEKLVWEMFGVLMGLGVLVTYTLLLIGIWAIAKQQDEDRLIKNIRAFIVVGVISWTLLSAASLTSVFLSPLLITFTILGSVSIFVLGIYAIRLGKDFIALQSKLGAISKKAGYWHKISGWLIVSIVLMPIGAIFSLFADYYMWRILRENH